MLVGVGGELLWGEVLEDGSGAGADDVALGFVGLVSAEDVGQYGGDEEKVVGVGPVVGLYVVFAGFGAAGVVGEEFGEGEGCGREFESFSVAEEENFGEVAAGGASVAPGDGESGVAGRPAYGDAGGEVVEAGLEDGLFAAPEEERAASVLCLDEVGVGAAVEGFGGVVGNPDAGGGAASGKVTGRAGSRDLGAQGQAGGEQHGAEDGQKGPHGI